MPMTNHTTTPVAPHRHTTWRPSAADDAAITTIADAMRARGLSKFPTRASALRYALQATEAALMAAGGLPSVPDVQQAGQ